MDIWIYNVLAAFCLGVLQQPRSVSAESWYDGVDEVWSGMLLYILFVYRDSAEEEVG